MPMTLNARREYVVINDGGTTATVVAIAAVATFKAELREALTGV